MGTEHFEVEQQIAVAAFPQLSFTFRLHVAILSSVFFVSLSLCFAQASFVVVLQVPANYRAERQAPFELHKLYLNIAWIPLTTKALPKHTLCPFIVFY